MRVKPGAFVVASDAHPDREEMSPSSPATLQAEVSVSQLALHPVSLGDFSVVTAHESSLRRRGPAS
jgi:hypothetical protein